jgi:hypothetical protein
MFPIPAVEKLRSRLSDGERLRVVELGAELERLWQRARAA